MAAEPVQARRYPTRARTKAEDSPVDVKPPQQRGGRKLAENQKAIATTDEELSVSLDRALPATRVTRVSRRVVAPKVIGETTGVKAAPKRKSTRNAGGAAKRISTTKTPIATSKSLRQVTFNDDKENLVPSGLGDIAIHHEDDDTDELMSSSMGALSVKPFRVPSTKFRLSSAQTATSSAFDRLPALSPLKVRRPPQVLRADDQEMEDELSSPMPPVLKLAPKPKRGGAGSSFSVGLTEAAGALDLRKPLDLSASLLTSPARRPIVSPFKPIATSAPFSKSSTETLNAISGSSLASPARRLPSVAISNFGGLIKGDSRLGPKVVLGVEIPDLSKPGVRSPPKRVPRMGFVKIGETEDELGMDLDNYVLGRSPSRFPEGGIDTDRSIEVVSIENADESLVTDISNWNTDMQGLSSQSNLRDTSPTATCRDGIMVSTLQERAAGMDTDKDVPMRYGDDADNLMNRMSPIAKKYTSQMKEGSGYNFFDLETDEDELPGLRYASSVFSTHSKVGIQSERRNLFPATTSKKLGCRIPIDPFLLNLDAPDNFLGVIESSSRKITIPIKLHSVDDVVSGDEDYAIQKNQHYFDPRNTSIRNYDGSQSDSVFRASNVLAGAVVFVDVYTSEGADASSAFVEALRGLGAKVLRSWNWNLNSTGGLGEGERKIGITHVVFKDGSPRTLQKVKDSKGVVLCVGVGWVTACEEDQAWIDESIYPVNLDHVPRGGHRRRKSMEPKSLIGIPNHNPTALGSTSVTATNFSAPPKTPKPTLRNVFPQTEQQRKQDVEPNQLLMQNLLMARRKSMQFAPKIGSPLRRFAALAMD